MRRAFAVRKQSTQRAGVLCCASVCVGVVCEADRERLCAYRHSCGIDLVLLALSTEHWEKRTR